MQAPSLVTEPSARLASEILETLRLADERGFALALAELAAWLHGGPAPVPAVEAAARATPGVVVKDGVACLEGRERLVDALRARRAAHDLVAERMNGLAERFARDLATWCPWVESVAVCGSLGSRAFAPGDDLDFNVLSARGTKYLTYLAAVLLGIAYSARHHRATRDGTPALPTPVVRKLVCINVVWPAEQTAPFARQDAQMAFELLLSRPLVGARRWREVVDANPGLVAHFPQLRAEAPRDEPLPRRPLPARALAALTRRPLPRRAAERAARGLAWCLWALVQRSRRRNPEALARVAFLRRVKYPYDVFQEDGP